ncbi:MAG TPA: YqiA/YcfP family alpha/beta fold hydrolase [Casimicrobiaceae bacterium]|nr:YqiA/YcfP family alpha/beta fold hydrolase [Casimicrobiaceae bacterium]
MSTTTILYLHGFRSSPASIKAGMLREAVERLPATERPRLHVPALDASPANAMATTAEWIETHVSQPAESLTIIGSSLGGYYATWLAECFACRGVMINPAIRPYDDLSPYVGPQVNLYTGETFVVTERHFDELRALSIPSVTNPERYLLLVQSGDEVLDYREAVAFYRGSFQYVEGGGDHTFTTFASQISTILRFAAVRLAVNEQRA